MKNKFLKISSGISISILIFLSLGGLQVVSAQDNVAGGGTATGITYECKGTDANGKAVYGNCTWADLVAALNKVIDVGMKFALAFSVVVLAYAGFRYMTSQGNATEISKANAMFVSVAWGIFYMLGAWLIVHLITSSLLNGNIKSPI